MKCLTDKDSSEPFFVDVDELAVRTCPKCGYYMQRFKVDSLTRYLLGTKGKWHCLNPDCGYVEEVEPTLEVTDKVD